MLADHDRHPSYHSLLKACHDYLLPGTYVEIGVQHGHSLALAGSNTFCIGIDPNPDILCPLPALARIYPLSSDDFFARFDLRQELLGKDLDLAFIDGMHLFEFGLRDFINLERHCNTRSLILVHDVSPINETTSRRNRVGRVWTGDIWKLIICLKEYRYDLNILTADVEPSGLAIIRNLDPKNRILEERYDEIICKYIDLDVNIVLENRTSSLNLVCYGDAWGALTSRH